MGPDERSRTQVTGGTSQTTGGVTSVAVRAAALRLGFDLVGIARVGASDHARFYREWLSATRHGDMAYLARPDAVARRTAPDRGVPGARSAIVVALNYYHPGDAGDDVAHGGDVVPGDGVTTAGGVVSGDVAPAAGVVAPEPSRGVIARYARGRDYHKVVKKKLVALLRWLEAQCGRPLPLARACVDTAPVLERDLGRLAGLGWFGRNTMLIHPRLGSYFVLGVLFVELELEPDEPFAADHCGRCHACLDACPTGALLGRNDDGAPVIDASRCISYLTIELRGPIPRELRPAIGNRIFGCDICQEVCPFTRRFSRPSPDPAFAARAPGEPPFGVELEANATTSHPGTASPALIHLLETALDDAAWDAFTRGSPLRRPGRAGFARNVCVALGNWGSPEAVPVLTAALADPEPLVRGHAAWALGRVESPAARAALEAACVSETDPFVRDELELALAGVRHRELPSITT